MATCPSVGTRVALRRGKTYPDGLIPKNSEGIVKVVFKLQQFCLVAFDEYEETRMVPCDDLRTT